MSFTWLEKMLTAMPAVKPVITGCGMYFISVPSRSIDADALQRLTQDAGMKHARLRAEHLRTHLAQTALMTPQQIARYNSLRGYDTAHHQHTPEMSHGHHPAHR